MLIIWYYLVWNWRSLLYFSRRYCLPHPTERPLMVCNEPGTPDLRQLKVEELISGFDWQTKTGNGVPSKCEFILCMRIYNVCVLCGIETWHCVLSSHVEIRYMITRCHIIGIKWIPEIVVQHVTWLRRPTMWVLWAKTRYTGYTVYNSIVVVGAFDGSTLPWVNIIEISLSYNEGSIQLEIDMWTFSMDMRWELFRRWRRQ